MTVWFEEEYQKAKTWLWSKERRWVISSWAMR